MLTPNEQDDGKLCVVIGTRLTLTQYQALRNAYPGRSQSQALRQLVDDLCRDNTSALDREIEKLQRELQERQAARREVGDKEIEAQMEAEEEERARQDREHAKRLRTEALRSINGKLNPWLDTAIPDADVDVADAVRRIASEEGITDQDAIQSAIDSGERALERRREYSKKDR